MPVILTFENCGWKVGDFPVPKMDSPDSDPDAAPELARVLQLMDPMSGILINVPFFDPEVVEALEPLAELTRKRSAAANSRIEVAHAPPPGVDLTKMPPGNGQPG